MKRELQTIEERISEAESCLAGLNRQLEDPALATDSTALAELYGQLQAQKEKVDRLYERWDYPEKKRQIES